MRVIESLVVGVPKHIVPRERSEATARFEKATGILKTRRFDGTTLEMIKATLDQCWNDFDPSAVHNLIVITQSPDQFSPCMAINIHSYLGLKDNVQALDVGHACDAWAVGINLANHLDGKTILICADRLRFGKPKEPESYIFSDSVSVSTISQYGSDPFETYTDGTDFRELYCGLNGEMHMNGAAVFDFVTTKVPRLVKKFPAHDYLILHQANASMNKIVASRSGYKDFAPSSIEEYGNQSMNSIPTCIAMHEKTLLDKKVLAVGFGAGFSAAAISLDWRPNIPSRIVEI